MSTDGATEILAAWDEVTRSARTPHQPARMRSRVRFRAGALALGSIVLALALAQPLLQGTIPGGHRSPSSSSTAGDPASSATRRPSSDPGSTPLVVDGWVVPTPYPLPAGAVLLPLDTLPVPEHLNIPSGAILGLCPLKAIRVHVEYDPAGSPSLTFNGGGRGPIWPYGVSARFYQGRAEIVLPDGAVVARDGDSNIFAGGLYGSTGRDAICLPGTGPIRPGGASLSSPPADASASNVAVRVMNSFLGEPQLAGLTTKATPSGLEVVVALTRNDDRVPDVWLADLAVGAIAEQSRTNEAVASDVVSTATAVGPGEGGNPVTTFLGIGAVRLGQVFGSPDDSALIARVAVVAESHGLTVADLRILHPLESALSVKFVVPDGATIDWTLDELRTELVGAPPELEGVFIELRDSHGQPLLQSGAAYRTGAGGLWFAPGQDSRFGAVHSGTPGR